VIRALTALEREQRSYGEGCADAKLALLGRLATAKLHTARAVVRLHEVLCFLRAYPDDARVLARVERMLDRFHRRADLRRHRVALADTGIAGTAIHYRFFWATLHWLARRWPERLQLDRADKEPAARIRAALPLLVTRVEAAWLKESGVPALAALDRLHARSETDAVFLARRIAAMPGDTFTREAFSDAIDAAYRLDPGPDTPSRTRARYAAAPVVFQTKPLRRDRPDLREQIALAPRAVDALSPREGARLIDLARGVMVTHGRDLDAFAYGDPRDVRIVVDGAGLSFMVNGVLPERRPVIPGIYGYLTLHNGVPIGYGQLDFVGRSAAISFNTFEAFRGGETALTFARLLAMAHHLFGAASFSLEPYQLGSKNEEAIASGAWWFYYKLGFRPHAVETRRILKEELARMKKNPEHRSSRATLRKLAASHVFFDLDRSRPADLPELAQLGLQVAQTLAARAGGDRERALEECSQEAMWLTGLRSLQGYTAEERLAWMRWAPLVVTLPGISRWSAADKRTLVRVIRAKGGRRDSDYVALFAAHPKLERALFSTR
jgi:hypothetical protein